MASITRSLKSFGCGLVNRTRRMPGDRADRAEQVGEIVRAVVVRVDGLPEQDDLGQPLGRRPRCDLAHDVGERAAALGPARRRHDAVRAAIVAAALHRNPRLDAADAARAKVLVVLSGSNVVSTRPRRRARARSISAGSAAIAVGTDDQTHVRRSLEQQPAPRRCAMQPVTPSIVSRRHVPLELAEAAEHPLLRVVADRAGVDQDHVGAVRLGHRS